MYSLIVVAQIPPTPTLLPVATAPVSMPEVGVWAVTDDLLQMWNSSGIAAGAQILVIAGLVLVGLFVFLYYIRQYAGRDE